MDCLCSQAPVKYKWHTTISGHQAEQEASMQAQHYILKHSILHKHYTTDTNTFITYYKNQQILISVSLNRLGF